MTASLMPMGKLQFFGNTGLPLAGGMVYVYQAGTMIATTSWTDSTGTVLNTWPVVLDSAGRANIWIKGYVKVTLTDSLGNLIWTVDNVSMNPFDQSLNTTDSPSFANINVSGLATVSGLKVTTGAVAGYILTAINAFGNVGWAPSGGSTDMVQIQVFL